MMENHPAIIRTTLFAEISREELARLFSCLNAKIVDIAQGGFALTAGDEPDAIGVVLEGRMQVIREDAEGNRAVLAALDPGELYGEALVCAEIGRSPVSVIALTPSKVMKICYRRILTRCPNACAFHTTLVENMMKILARKLLTLQRRMELLDVKTIRGRLLAYLEAQRQEQGDYFRLPFDRAGLAEHLAVDRSALSRELSRLRDEGILTYRKNEFRML